MATTTKKPEPKLGPGDDAQMIRSPGLWPRWPVLPVKKPGFWEDQSGKKMGVIFDEPRDKGWRIIHVNLYAVGTMPEEKWKKVCSEATRYESLEALLADGWVVD